LKQGKKKHSTAKEQHSKKQKGETTWKEKKKNCGKIARKPTKALGYEDMALMDREGGK